MAEVIPLTKFMGEAEGTKAKDEVPETTEKLKEVTGEILQFPTNTEIEKRIAYGKLVTLLFPDKEFQYQCLSRDGYSYDLTDLDNHTIKLSGINERRNISIIEQNINEIKKVLKQFSSLTHINFTNSYVTIYKNGSYLGKNPEVISF